MTPLQPSADNLAAVNSDAPEVAADLDDRLRAAYVKAHDAEEAWLESTGHLYDPSLPIDAGIRAVLREAQAHPSRGVVDEKLLGKLRCLAVLLQQLNAQTACAAVNEAVETIEALQAAALPAVPEVDAMVNRFLAWPLPSDFGPDAGISFTPCPHPNGWPVGTNLLTAVQAKAMFLHCLAAPSTSPAVPEEWVYGWLIENGRSPPDLRYRAFDSVGMPYWTDDNAKAIRLCRRDDAEQLAAGDEDAWRIVEHRWLAATPALPAVPDGWVLVPERMHLSVESLEALSLQCGGVDPESTDLEERWCSGTLWVGDILDDDGKPTHGLHLSNDECPEEGSMTLVEFAATPAHDQPEGDR